jgi:hypothetical protein
MTDSEGQNRCSAYSIVARLWAALPGFYSRWSAFFTLLPWSPSNLLLSRYLGAILSGAKLTDPLQQLPRLTLRGFAHALPYAVP